MLGGARPGRVPLVSRRFARYSGQKNKNGAESRGKRESPRKRLGYRGSRGSLAPEIEAAALPGPPAG